MAFRESAGGNTLVGSDADSDWIVVNIPAPRDDVTRGATATTTLPLHHDGDDDEVTVTF